jgi:hypothetical protein
MPVLGTVLLPLTPDLPKQSSLIYHRLNLQHYWATLTCGYLLHPDIPVPEDARIADIATGTGYLLSASRSSHLSFIPTHILSRRPISLLIYNYPL